MAVVDIKTKPSLLTIGVRLEDESTPLVPLFPLGIIIGQKDAEPADRAIERSRHGVRRVAVAAALFHRKAIGKEDRGEIDDEAASDNRDTIRNGNDERIDRPRKNVITATTTISSVPRRRRHLSRPAHCAIDAETGGLEL